MIYGYARTFRDQTALSNQLDKLLSAGCQEIRKEDISSNAMIKPELNKIVEKLCYGDEFIVCNMSQICKRLPDLLKFFRELQDRGVRFKSIDDGIDSVSPSAFFDIVDAMRSFVLNEREINLRARASRSKQKGPGRPSVMSAISIAEAFELRAQNKSYKAIADSLNVSVGVIHKILNK